MHKCIYTLCFPDPLSNADERMALFDKIICNANITSEQSHKCICNGNSIGFLFKYLVVLKLPTCLLPRFFQNTQM